MILKLLFVEWMSTVLAIVVFSLVVLNMKRLGVIKMLAFWLSVVSIALSIIISAYTNISKEKVGATCEDGWKSDSTGSGTCSHHGGVETWKYKYWFDE